MKIGNIPGLTYSIFPGLTRTVDAGAPYTAASKIAIMSGDALTEAELTNLKNFDQYLIDNASKLVYSTDLDLEFTWDSARLKRTINVTPLGSITATAVNTPVPVSETYPEDSIPLKGNMWALIKCDDKDASLNTEGNDIVIFTPNVGTTSTDFVSLNQEPVGGEEFKIINVTISLFRGYQNTDEVIEIEDPEDSEKTIVVGSEKSIYFNDVMQKRVSEAYRKILVSTTSTRPNTLDIDVWYTNGMAMEATIAPYSPYYIGDRFTSHIYAYNMSGCYDGVMANQSFVDILEDIQQKILNGTFPLWRDTLLNDKIYEANDTSVEGADYNRTNYYNVAKDGNHLWGYTYVNPGSNFFASKVIESAALFEEIDDKYRINGVVVYHLLFSKDINLRERTFEYLVNKCGYSRSQVDRAKLSFKGYDLDNSKFTSTYANGNLTVQYTEPFHLDSKFRTVAHNPTNENMYLILNSNRDYCQLNKSKNSLTGFDGVQNASGYTWNHEYFLGVPGDHGYAAGYRRPLIEMSTADIVNGVEAEDASYRMNVDTVIISLATKSENPEIPNTEDIVLNDMDTITSFDGFAAIFTVANKH